MKTSRAAALVVLNTLFLGISAGILSAQTGKTKSDPLYSGNIIVAGLISEVTVFRDMRGMPHIYAANEHDLYWVTGYITAQERLWQMDLIRRSSTGHLAEIFGKSFVQTDLFMRSLDIESKSRVTLMNEDPEVLGFLQAYTEGVNAFIETGCRQLPPEFRILGYKPSLWRTEDIAGITGFMGWNLASRNLLSEIFNYRLVKKLGPEKAKELIPEWKYEPGSIYPNFFISDSTLNSAEEFIRSSEKIGEVGVVPLSGSNNWALAGSRTNTGKPVLSNDMHLTLMSPGIWMQMHQVVPGKINVTGVLIPGEPFIVGGHNEKIAWGMTNLMVDDIDLFAEKINPENPDQYFYNGEWKEMSRKYEVIKVKHGKDDTSLIRFTHRGPIISGFHKIEETALSIRWTGNYPSDEIKGVCLLNRAGSWDDFRNGLKYFRTISQNFIFADTGGNIGLNTGGGIPLRKQNGNLIRNGENDEDDWTGFVNFEELPSSFNPENGYVSSANNKTVNNDYPYYISTDFCLPYRINRIRQMIKEKDIMGMDDFRRMILDQHSNLAEIIIPYILKAADGKNDLTETEKKALSYLKDWDYEMNPDLIAPSVFEFFRISLKKNLLEDEFGDLYDQVYYNIPEFYIYRIFNHGPDSWVDNINTTSQETLDDIVRKSFKDCVGEILQRYGHNTKKWEWGNIHRVTLEHPLGSVGILNLIFHFNSKEYRIGGSDHTVSPYFSFKQEFQVEYGASERHIFNTSDWDESLTVIPTGASGIPGNEYYLSQTKTFIEGGFYKDAFSEEAVRAAAKYILKFRPAN